jgi:hypothetical protein
MMFDNTMTEGYHYGGLLCLYLNLNLLSNEDLAFE